VNDLIERFGRSGKQTVFLCTHLLHEAQRLCDRVAVINRGKLLALGSPAELARDLFPGVRLHVKVTQALTDPVQSELRQVEMVEEITMNDMELQIKLRQEAQIPDLVAWLVNRNIRVCSFMPQEISLEDVYFTLQKRANGGAA